MTVTPPRIHDLIAAVETARAGLLDAARPAAVERVHSRGRLSARERLARLIDAGSFSEIGALVTAEQDDDGPEAAARARAQTPADGVVTGTARIDGRPVVIISQDFSVFGGSIGKLGSAKTQRMLQIAIRRGIPMVHAARRRRPPHPGRPELAPLRPRQRHVPRSRARVRLDSDGGADAGRGLRRPTNYAGLADFVVMVRGLSTMGLAGPALVKAATGEETDSETLGGAEVQVDQQGLADLGVDRRGRSLRRGQALPVLPAGQSRAPLPSQPTDDPATAATMPARPGAGLDAHASTTCAR